MGQEIDVWYILYSIGLTVFFVGIIGFERQRKHKIAGLTTHILVALGACTLTIVQEVMVKDAIDFINANPALAGSIVVERQRIVAQIIAGVGFFGTGAIIKRDGMVSGLTTASTLWVSAIIGITFGYGSYMLGMIVSITAVIMLFSIKRIFRSQYVFEEEEGE